MHRSGRQIRLPVSARTYERCDTEDQAVPRNTRFLDRQIAEVGDRTGCSLKPRCETENLVGVPTSQTGAAHGCRSTRPTASGLLGQQGAGGGRRYRNLPDDITWSGDVVSDG